jgi:cation diffusion facilitator family transporter
MSPTDPPVQPNPQDHEYRSSSETGDAHTHVRGKARSFRGRHGLRALLVGHEHSGADKIDTALETSQRGIRALKVSLAGLGITALFQLVIVALSGSVGLLSDTVHNFADALTALPLWLAFSLAKRPRTRRFTHGYGRAEDIAGIFVVVVIALSAVLAGYESIRRLIEPRPISNLGLVFIASAIGFVGNEWVALYRIRVGRDIGSAALVADGLHARVDGLTSLAVLAGAAGVAAGYEKADPIAGLLITVAILAILKNVSRDIYWRLMDSVSPDLVAAVERSLEGVHGIKGIDDVRLRWIGHRLRAEVEIQVQGSLSVSEGHAIAVAAHHKLLHDVPKLGSAIVHANPSDADGFDHHAELAHHFAKSDEMGA